MRRAIGALLLAAFASLPAAAQDADALTKFRRAFESDAPAAERVDAVRGVALAEGRAPAEAVCRALGGALARIESLAKERTAVRAECVSLMAGRPDAKKSEAEEIDRRVAALRVREEELREADRGEREVAKALRDALRAFVDEKAVEYLCGPGLRGSPEAGVRSAVAEALGASGSDAAVAALRGALKDRETSVREAALAALGRNRAKEDETIRALAAGLEDERWTLRLVAARKLAEIAVPEAVDLLVGRLAREEGRLRRDLCDLLRGLTGQSFGVEPEGWTYWWKENREAYATGAKRLAKGGAAAPPEEKGPAKERVSYYGITTYSRRVLYVLDISGSMNDAGGGPEGLARVDEAKKELLRSIRELDSGCAFTVYAFGDSVQKWKPALAKATAEAKEDVRKWIDALEAASWTNTYAALEDALRASAANPKNDMGADYAQAADTIFLLTDGAPTTPQGKNVDASGKPEWHRVLEAVRDWNREKRVVVHAIGVGDVIQADFLAALARENGGRFVRAR